jgi:spore maturation protein CgeB
MSSPPNTVQASTPGSDITTQTTNSNVTTAIATLTPWEDRKSKNLEFKSIVGQANARFSQIEGAFVFGFGLPPIEAMACGTPVVCSRAGSLPEVVGDAALLVSPESIADLAAALREVLDHPDVRARLRHKGLERAARFTWEAAAQRTSDVYRHAHRCAAA